MFTLRQIHSTLYLIRTVTDEIILLEWLAGNISQMTDAKSF